MDTSAKPRAPRNQTLTLTSAERRAFVARLVRFPASPSRPLPLPLDSILDRLICSEMSDALARIPDGVADLVLLDPPYNLTKRFGKRLFRRRSEDAYESWLAEWLPSIKRILKPTGSLYACGDWTISGAWQRQLGKHFVVRNRITWEREKGRGARSNWKNASEDIWFCTVSPKKYWFNATAVKLRRRVLAPYTQEGTPKDWEDTDQGRFRSTHGSNFWSDITVPFWSMPENTDHPTQKPEKLMAKLILASAPPSGLVIDPFVGSGTSAVVAKKLGRHFIGIDSEEDYLCWALKRLDRANHDSGIQGYQDGLFWERNSLKKPVD